MKRGSIFETDGIPRIQEALPLALQHVVAMIVGCLNTAQGADFVLTFQERDNDFFDDVMRAIRARSSS